MPPVRIAFLMFAVATVALPALAQAPQPITNAIDMKFVRILPGQFLMGSPADEADRGSDETAHEVKITRPFSIGVHEVTQGQYETVMGANPSWFRKGGGGEARVVDHDASTYPVDDVTWQQASEFCSRLSNLPAEKKAGRSYRLPTEAEWEYACRAGAKTPFHYGPSLDADQANFCGLSPYKAETKPYYQSTWSVGSYEANKFGLYDMHGNVQEWCADWYAPYAEGMQTDPKGAAKGEFRVARGGSWMNSGRNCRAAQRNKLDPGYSHYGLGFRVVLEQ